MKKIVLLALIASSAVFAESAADMMKDAAAAEAKTEVVAEVKDAATEALEAEANASEQAVEKEAEKESM